MRLGIIVGCLLVAACGGATTRGEDPASSVGQGAQPTFVMDEGSCTKGSKPTAADATTKIDPSDRLAVVQLLFVDECTGAGGNWIIAREIGSHRRFFLGAHACRIWTTPPAGRYGVVRHRQTAGMRSTPEGACVAFPGEEALSTDQATSAFVVFETQHAAEAFATERGWIRP